MNKKILMPMLIMILLVSSVYGLGVAPAYKNVVFSPNTDQEITFRIINNEEQDISVALVPKKDLAKYIEVPEEVIHIKASEYQKEVTYTIKMPEKLQPGTRIGEIMVIQVGDQGSSDSNVVQASLGIIHQARVLVPYPDQYVQGNLVSQNIQPGKPTTFTVELINLGDQQVQQVSGNLIVSGPDGEGVAFLDTNEISLDAKERGKITATWDVDAGPGNYNVQAIVQYDDKVLLLEKDISIGNPAIEIIDLRTNSFKLGQIAKLDIVMQSNWNKELENVYSDVKIKDASEATMLEYSTPLVDIPPYGRAESSIFWDTKNIEEGDYTVDIKTNYLRTFTSKLFETIVSENSIIVKGSALTGEVIADEPQGYIRGGISTIVILILVGVIAKLVLDRRSKPKIKQEQVVVKQAIQSVPQEEEERLYQYIKKKLIQGYDKEAIRENLLNKGWTKVVVDMEMLKAEEELEELDYYHKSGKLH